MPYTSDATGHSWLSAGTPSGAVDKVDRGLLIACAVIWLLALGASVAAIVALVNLAGGRAANSGSSGTPWLLYAVIGISAAVIIGAVPLLLRARRDAAVDAPPIRDRGMARQPQGGARAGERSRAFGGGAANQINASISQSWAARPSARAMQLTASVDQVWLRCAAVIGCVMGGATLAVAIATYLLADDHSGFAWTLIALAGLATLALFAVPWFYLRELRDILDDARY